MQIGFVGLGKMGGNMVHRIERDSDHEVVAFDPNPDAVAAAEGHGADRRGVARGARVQARAAAHGLADGAVGQDHRGHDHSSSPSCSTRATRSSTAATRTGTTTSGAPTELEPRGIHYADVGTSGGVWGLDLGYCMMAGGPDESIQQLAPILDVLAPPDGWRHFGPAGAGHFVKMVHNGVEYGMMQAYAEGFDLMHQSDFPIELKEVAGLWNRGSVVRSWLCELAEKAFEQEGNDLAQPAGLRRRLRRGPLDDGRRDRDGGPDARARRLAVRALLLAQGGRLRGPRARRAAQPVRRPRGQEGRGDLMAVDAQARDRTARTR